jgi:hypothetical protein
MASDMFTEYNVAGICEKTGLRPNGNGWRELMRDNQFTAANQGPEFGKTVMRLFSQIETKVRVSKQMPEDSTKYHPLSAILKGRYFEHIVSNEREVCPRHLRLNGHRAANNGPYETFQFFPDTRHSRIYSL